MNVGNNVHFSFRRLFVVRSRSALQLKVDQSRFYYGLLKFGFYRMWLQRGVGFVTFSVGYVMHGTLVSISCVYICCFVSKVLCWVIRKS